MFLEVGCRPRFTGNLLLSIEQSNTMGLVARRSLSGASLEFLPTCRLGTTKPGVIAADRRAEMSLSEGHWVVEPITGEQPTGRREQQDTVFYIGKDLESCRFRKTGRTQRTVLVSRKSFRILLSVTKRRFSTDWLRFWWKGRRRGRISFGQHSTDGMGWTSMKP